MRCVRVRERALVGIRHWCRASRTHAGWRDRMRRGLRTVAGAGPATTCGPRRTAARPIDTYERYPA